MATLIVAATQRRAKEEFDRLELNEETTQEWRTNGDYYTGHGGHLYGMRFDEIRFIDPLVLDERTWDWMSRCILCRLAPEGKITWALQ